MPDFVPPMLPALHDRPPRGAAWIHEIKYDGYRTQIRIDGGQARMLTRNGHDWTHRFRDLPAAGAALPVRSAIIDGEVVTIRPDGVTSYRDLLTALSGDRSKELHYYAFDVLWHDGQDLRRAPLLERKARLRTLIAESSGPIIYSDHIVGAEPDLLSRFCAMGLEGIVSKRADSRYVSGRSDIWRKSKCTKRHPFVIGGWRRPATGVAGVGALLLGALDEQGQLVYAGKVGTGWDVATSVALQGLLETIAIERSPFSDRMRRGKALWVRPELVCEISYAEWDPPHEIRHASFKGLREEGDVKRALIRSPE